MSQTFNNIEDLINHFQNGGKTEDFNEKSDFEESYLQDQTDLPKKEDIKTTFKECLDAFSLQNEFILNNGLFIKTEKSKILDAIDSSIKSDKTPQKDKENTINKLINLFYIANNVGDKDCLEDIVDLAHNVNEVVLNLKDLSISSAGKSDVVLGLGKRIKEKQGLPDDLTGEILTDIILKTDVFTTEEKSIFLNYINNSNYMTLVTRLVNLIVLPILAVHNNAKKNYTDIGEFAIDKIYRDGGVDATPDRFMLELKKSFISIALHYSDLVERSRDDNDEAAKELTEITDFIASKMNKTKLLSDVYSNIVRTDE